MLKKATPRSCFSSIASVLILAASTVWLQFSHYRLIKFGTDTAAVSDAVQWNEQSAAQRLAILRALPRFGYRNLFADWTFLNFLQYFGNSGLRRTVGYGLSANYFKSVIDSDPYFISSYVFFVNSVSMYAGQPEQTVALLKEGLASMGPDIPSRSYFIWRHKGTDELLFIGDNRAAQESYQTAAVWAEQASDDEAPLVARLSRETAQFLATDPNGKPAQISAWADVLLRAIDDEVRRNAISNIEALGGTILYSANGQVTVRYRTEDP